MKIRNKINQLSGFILVLGIVVSCSTERDTFINRTYHGTTARYNGWFNANELMRMSLNAYKISLKEDYYEQLPIDPLPNEEQVVGLYPAIDTSIVKCTKVIQKHSMPSAENSSSKDEEYNNWIDENWLMIGIANFYRRDYDAAMRNFKFIKRFFDNDPSVFTSELWMAKTNIQLNNITEAGFNLAVLDDAILEEEAAKEDKNKSNDDDEKRALVPNTIKFDLEKTKAELALKKGNPADAIKYLESALTFAKKQRDKSRMHFIIAQLYESVGDKESAKNHYTQVLKFDAPFEMHFNARLKRAFMGGDEKVKKELLKMLRDAKNAQFKDQIYYALADIELQQTNKPKAKEYLTQSAFYSVDNSRQKGMAYEKLGDLSFFERNYVSAQKYYDSCATVINDQYPNAEGIRTKAEKLSDLVFAVETASFEDSVQRIAALGEDERIAFVENVIKQTKEDIERKKIKEAERLRELQQNQNLFVQNEATGNKWYFSNAKMRSDGFDEFRKLWGSRENEDNWRRSDKDPVMNNTDLVDVEIDTTNKENPTPVSNDTLTLENLLANIPLTDSLLELSNLRQMEALYNAGIIYKEQLKETDLAIAQFDAVMKEKIQGEFELSSAFQLYKIYETIDANQSGFYKDFILASYSTSDYANYLRDPDFFIKKKEREALAEQEYINQLERYNRGLYSVVIAKANNVIDNEPENKFRSKYMLLKSMALGQTNADKKVLLPVLNAIVSEYEGTAEAVRASEMITIIENGYSVSIPLVEKAPSPFTYVKNEKLWLMIFLDDAMDVEESMEDLEYFNDYLFDDFGYELTEKQYDNKNFILVQEFQDVNEANDYLRVFKSSKKQKLDLTKLSLYLISKENLKILFEKQNLEAYESFYEENY